MVEYDAFAYSLAQFDNPAITFISLIIDKLSYFAIAILLLYLLFIKKDRKRAALILFTYIILIVLIPTLKFTFPEIRPCSAPWKIDCPTDNALPSGHAAAYAVLVAAYLFTPAFPMALLLYMIASLSRIYLGVHVFKDILAGTAVAFTVFLLLDKFIFKTSLRFEKENKKHAKR